MESATVDDAMSKPEEDAAVCAEALQVGIPWRTVLSVVVDPGRDAERRQCRGVEVDRAIDVAG
jgi:hypothetical protein